jgi:hypothetical protein
MPANYTLIEKITVGAAGASSVTFSGIPQTGYTDLVVKASSRQSDNNNLLYITFNGNSSSYTGKRLYGDGATASSDAGGTAFLNPTATVSNSYTASTFGTLEMCIPNYASANYKSVSIDSATENNATTAYAMLYAGLWSNTAAITSITFTAVAANLVQYSTFYLYGVAALGTTPAIVPYATGGDTIMTDGTYWYHTFTSSGTFTPQKAISCDYLVVAGGGGGAGSGDAAVYGGGGGAGGLRSTVTATGGGGTLESPLSLASGTGYTVTIGAGGAGGSGTYSGGGSPGSNSVFSTITSTAGGGGGGFDEAADNGGSGGGQFASGSVGTGTANQGYAGGAGARPGNNNTGGGGGGGGANSVGATGAGGAGVGGAGGTGVAVSITGSSITYAGGGGGAGGVTGGAGGSSIGGAGGTTNAVGSSASPANRGSGGGGAATNQDTTTRSGGAGSSGIVIVRYAV